MEVLSEAMNTCNPALGALLMQGYCLRAELDGGEDPPSAWIAERPDVRLSASTPLALLGLAMLWQQHGPRWQAAKNPHIHDSAHLYERLLDGETIFGFSRDLER